MIKQIPSQIYKSEARGVLKTETNNCFSTFNFEQYQDLSRKPFGVLQVLNEEILAPQQSLSKVLIPNTYAIFLPLFGGIELKDNLGSEEFLRVEQLREISVNEELEITIFNPYETENVSYLEIHFQMEKLCFQNFAEQSEMDFSIHNTLNSLFETEKALGFAGVFDGRKKGIYTLKNPENGVFVFIINGAFEVEDRLLEAKDGLSLQNIISIEWEALSENAVLLVFEVCL